MKLSELKAAVYLLAQVGTTKQLKKQYEFARPLDMRFKASWEKVLVHLQTESQQVSENQISENTDESFEAWASNPPSEYAALFAEADEALETFDRKLLKTKKLTKTAIAMANSLDEFAEASLDEAKRLAKAAQTNRKRVKEADLN